MKHRISVINKSSGKFSTEKINGRDHLVTSMVAIEGDSVMNELFYPNSVVTNAAAQLDMLPAPDGHPNVDGRPVSAFNPLAVNAHNFGGFTRSPIIENKRVIADLVIDIDVANRSERGKQIIKNIKDGKRIGVSTGLIADVIESSGNVNNQEFFGKVETINFDHVAILLNAIPAGKNTFTINHDVKASSKRGMTMDEITFDLSPLAVADRLLISNLNINELLSHVNHEITVDEAKSIVEKAGFHVNQITTNQVAEFTENQEAFTDFLKNRLDALNEVKDFIVKHSSMELEQLNGMDSDALESLSKSIAPKHKHIGNGKRPQKLEIELLDDNALVEA